MTHITKYVYTMTQQYINKNIYTFFQLKKIQEGNMFVCDLIIDENDVELQPLNLSKNTCSEHLL